MLRIGKSEGKLFRLAESSLSKSDHWERQLQAMICADPDPFCEELGESLWVIGQELRPSDAVADRIDILALDEGGHAVVIEFKRGSHKLQLLQAISYAGMVSRWPAERFIDTLATNFNQSKDDARAAIEDHTGLEAASINLGQRILLVAEDFDPALLVSVEWLHENYGVDIRCYRLRLARENGNDYLTCTCIYPPIEIASLSRKSDGRGEPAGTAWPDWDTALDAIENAAEKNFVKAELARGQEAYLAKRQVIYRIGGKRRLWVNCRKLYAYVWQKGRFDGDAAYWQELLSEPDHVQTKSTGRELRFRIASQDDFAVFEKAVRADLLEVEFLEAQDFAQPQSEG